MGIARTAHTGQCELGIDIQKGLAALDLLPHILGKPDPKPGQGRFRLPDQAFVPFEKRTRRFAGHGLPPLLSRNIRKTHDIRAIQNAEP